MIKPWRIKREEQIYDCPIFKAYRSWRQNPRTASEIDFILVRGPDWANVLALTANNEVVMVRQFRHGIEASSLELPGGCLEVSDSDPAAGAMREFTEETGYSAKLSGILLSAHANPAMMSQRFTAYLAENAERTVQQTLDEGEDIEVELVKLDHVRTMIERGEITHTITIAAFGMLAMRQKT